MLERYLTAASTYAHWIDYQFLLIAVLVGFWLILAEAVMFWLIFKFLAKDGRPTQYITGEQKHETRWITIPHVLVIVCDIVIIVPAIMVWYNIKQVLPPPDETVRVISQQWAWSFQQAGPDGVLDTADDIRSVG
jgi:cytochrome c oxidase subunit 2